MNAPALLPLSDLTVVEVSSFVAAPLCGMTLSQLGAQVIRIDPIGGASDVQRWPLAADGTSIYWTGLNKGKRSATVDLRSAEGQELVQRLIVEGDGIVVTNAVFPWLSHDLLASKRSDVPTNVMAGWYFSFSASANAIAGYRCPPVPPPANTTFIENC